MYGVDYEIPILDWRADAGAYGRVPIDTADPRSREPLVDIASRGVAGDSYYSRTDRTNAPYNHAIPGSLPQIWARKSVVDKLAAVNLRLVPFGVELLVWDAYRPVACQQGLWAFFQKQAEREIPDGTAAERTRYVRKYVSDPTRFRADDPTTWPEHSSGAAVDLTLRRLNGGELLDMGGEFDDMHGRSGSDDLERQLRSGAIGPQDPRLWNRRLLHWAMAEEGFVNYPFEFWHFDWGSQMYVMILRRCGHHAGLKAWYGYAKPPAAG